MTQLVRDPLWGDDRMFVAYDPETNEILANSPALGKNGADEGLAAMTAALEPGYLIYQFPQIEEAPTEECPDGS